MLDSIPVNLGMTSMHKKANLIVPRPLQLLNLIAHTRNSPVTIRNIQERRLRTVVNDACRKVPFYRELYRKANIVPGSIRSLADLPRLPLVAKGDYLDRPLAELMAEGIGPADCLSASSSGSSGHPLTVHWIPEDRASMNLSWKRAYLESGMGARDRVAAFSGRQTGPHQKAWSERLGFFPRLEISSWLKPEQWVDILHDWRPQVITGSIMTLCLLAEHVRDKRIPDIRPRIVFNSSELMGGSSRLLLVQVFGCRVIDLYGSEEAGCIAWECPACAGYHLAADMLIVELLKEGRPAEPGEDAEVVVTNLHSRAMPFIRYRQGDLVRVANGKPRCGSPFPLISLIEGRDEDFLVLRSGKRLPPPPFYHCIDPIPGIKRWRIIQEKAGTMRLELVVPGGLPAASMQKIAADLAALTQGQMEIEVATIADFPDVPGVKFRAIRSRAGLGRGGG
jgi:phenylacetate-CoA ligase